MASTSKLAVPSASTSSSTVTNDKAKLTKIEVEVEGKKCVLCKRSTVDEVNLGTFYALGDVFVHYYCLLFASSLPQNGQDEDGIWGFLIKDILAEVRRVHQKGANLKFYRCHFCREPGATIGCCLRACKIIYHFPCGLENGADFNFNSFATHCKSHTIKLPTRRRIHPSHKCRICRESLKSKPIGVYGVETTMGEQRVVFGSCCEASMFHKECVQQYALNAGAFFKCPTCAEKTTFKKEAAEQGIYVPDRDASWEMDPNAYSALKEKYSKCDAVNCVCPTGRNQNDKERDSMWYLRRCHYCAGGATHIGCSPTPLTPYDKWVCSLCSDVEATLSPSREKKEFMKCPSNQASSPSTTEDESSDEDDDVSSVSSGSSSSDGSLFSVVRPADKLPAPPSSPPTTKESSDEDDDLLSINSGSLSSDDSLFSVVRPVDKLPTPPLSPPTSSEGQNSVVVNQKNCNSPSESSIETVAIKKRKISGDSQPTQILPKLFEQTKKPVLIYLD